MQIIILVLGAILFVLSFLVVLNSSEQSNRLYPGSNIRFLATMPIAVMLLASCPWLISIPPEFSLFKTLILALVVVLTITYSAWVDSRFRGGLVKHAMHVQIVNRQGKSITFKRALWRNICKLILFPLAPLSFYFMIKDFRRQALHDKLTATFVIWTQDIIDSAQPESSIKVEFR